MVIILILLKNVAGKWVIDTTLAVYVYDTIVPELEIRQAGVLLDLEGTDTIYVEAGDVLEYYRYNYYRRTNK